ncbi:MAG: hypothetical protein L0Y56_22620, partial [Nitrospira sp.]|nr:hypothetical protein [Nitrospira sp.]
MSVLKSRIISALQEVDWETNPDLWGDGLENLAEFVIRQADCAAEIKEAPNPSSPQILLLITIALTTDFQRFAKETQAILTFLMGRLVELSMYNQGRFWHLKGYIAWRVDEGFFTAIQAFNTSLKLLKEAKEPAAKGYMARVYDSLGQLLLHQGLLREAKMYY